MIRVQCLCICGRDLLNGAPISRWITLELYRKNVRQEKFSNAILAKEAFIDHLDEIKNYDYEFKIINEFEAKLLELKNKREFIIRLISDDNECVPWNTLVDISINLKDLLVK